MSTPVVPYALRISNLLVAACARDLLQLARPALIGNMPRRIGHFDDTIYANYRLHEIDSPSARFHKRLGQKRCE